MATRWIAALFGLALLAPQAGLADSHGTIYDCTVPNSTDYWVGQKYVIAVEDGTGKVGLMDWVINKYNAKKPVMTTAIEDSAAKLVIGWTVDIIDDYGTRARLKFHAVILKSKASFMIDGSAPGYVNQFTGNGTCKITHK